MVGGDVVVGDDVEVGAGVEAGAGDAAAGAAAMPTIGWAKCTLPVEP